MIDCRHLHHRYESVDVITDVSLEIARGSLVAIVGSSGSGKSTLLSILSTLLTPSQGEVSIDGRSVRSISNLDAFRREKIGFAFQFHYLIRFLTAAENAMLPMAKRDRDHVAALFAAVGIERLLDRYPHELSGGERQRAALVRALVNGPDVVFADEPTGSLDSKNSRAIYGLLRERTSDGTTVVVATHDPEIRSFADRVIELRDGRVHQAG